MAPDSELRGYSAASRRWYRCPACGGRVRLSRPARGKDHYCDADLHGAVKLVEADQADHG
jgi:hypothetical protein